MQTIDWWKKLTIKHKLYSLIFINIFLVLFLSSNNAYEFSKIIIITSFIIGALIFYDLTRHLISTHKSQFTKTHILKRLLGILVITSLSLWSYFLFVELAMDTLNDKSLIIKSKLVNYTNKNHVPGVSKICYYFAVVVNEKNDTSVFCVEDIPNHKKLKFMIDKDVNLIARKSWAGIVIDDIKTR